MPIGHALAENGHAHSRFVRKAYSRIVLAAVPFRIRLGEKKMLKGMLSVLLLVLALATGIAQADPVRVPKTGEPAFAFDAPAGWTRRSRTIRSGCAWRST